MKANSMIDYYEQTPIEYCKTKYKIIKTKNTTVTEICMYKQHLYCQTCMYDNNNYCIMIEYITINQKEKKTKKQVSKCV